jgi:hypothetical protein
VARSCAAGQRALSAPPKRGVSPCSAPVHSACAPPPAHPRPRTPSPAYARTFGCGGTCVHAVCGPHDPLEKCVFVIMRFRFGGGVPVHFACSQRLRGADSPPPPTYAFSCLCSDFWLRWHVCACAVGATGAIGKNVFLKTILAPKRSLIGNTTAGRPPTGYKRHLLPKTALEAATAFFFFFLATPILINSALAAERGVKEVGDPAHFWNGLPAGYGLKLRVRNAPTPLHKVAMSATRNQPAK